MAGEVTKHKVGRGQQAWFRQGPLAPLREELEDLVSRFWGEQGDTWLSGAVPASMDVAETEKALEVKLDLPGFKSEDVDIQLSEGRLTISGERSDEQQEEDKQRNYFRMERRQGNFTRSLTLPCRVKEDEAVADYKDGVLTITLPKSDEAKTKRIQVQS
ncbi:MAG: Hsp20 family protein [Planctomycetales bacterium]|nr:Hsp20 family protein [Planctomycetales bacterium]NIM09124.1 Hsp20 family protein [Planctomycetales bacterium]NIN08591.1 Hsp20 family protein [Planctomycetales bacterium]NIN77717.1 Hsp20 family protein [Planctomycetales bacterium]NIO34889.1 Hsp20 family protein [Planctomycetales bacterium]